jgi:hypothetical protein
MEVSRIPLCIAVVDLGPGPSGRRIRFGLHSRLKSDWAPCHERIRVDRCPSEIDRREGSPAILCKIVQGRLSLAGERYLMVTMCGRTWSSMILQARSL